MYDAVSSLAEIEQKKKKKRNPLGERQQSDHPSAISFYLVFCQLVNIAQADRHTSSVSAACDLSHICINVYKYIYVYMYTYRYRTTNSFLILIDE